MRKRQLIAALRQMTNWKIVMKLGRRALNFHGLKDWEFEVRPINHEGKYSRMKYSCGSGTITAFDEAGRVISVWGFREGWPSKWEGPAMNAKDNDVEIDELEIVVDGLKRREPDDDPKP